MLRGALLEGVLGAVLVPHLLVRRPLSLKPDW